MSHEARPHYPTNLSDAQWALIEPLLPAPKSGPGLPGRRVVDQRRLVDAMLYVNKTGCQWRMLPHEFGALSTHLVRVLTELDPALGKTLIYPLVFPNLLFSVSELH